MPSSTRRLCATILAVVAALAWAPAAHAAGVVNISACQTLSIPNTTYKLTADLDPATATDCLVVAADKITIDMQGHTISGAMAAITDQLTAYDVITIKNGIVVGNTTGIDLRSSRVSIIGVEASHNSGYGISLRGPNGFIKSSVAHFNGLDGIFATGGRVQIQQTDASRNVEAGIDLSGDECLVTMNTANSNGRFGIGGSARSCTISFNTTNDSASAPGISMTSNSTGQLITHNTAMRNTGVDFQIACPSDVTFNTSSFGFPASYHFTGSPACHTANNQ
jgi:Right handed beta helix region